MTIDTNRTATTDTPEAKAPAGENTDTATAEGEAGAAERTRKGERRATGRARAPKPKKAAGRPAKAEKPAVKADRPKDGGKALRKAKAEPQQAVAKGESRKPRTGTKQEALIAMLHRPQGATIEEIVAATGWQKHTVRGAISGALKKKLRLTIESQKVDGRGRVYRIAG
jgi:hypothetical protein